MFLSLKSQQPAGVYQGWICFDNCACCLTEIEVADQTSCLILRHYTNVWLTSVSTDSKTPSACQGKPLEYRNFVMGMTPPGKRDEPHDSRSPSECLPVAHRGDNNDGNYTANGDNDDDINDNKTVILLLLLPRR